jgi:hypothetical protein
VKGDRGEAAQFDDDGDMASVMWSIPDPVVIVDPWNNNVWVNSWPAEATVTVAYDDGTSNPQPVWSTDIKTDGVGNGFVGGMFDINGGTVTASDGVTTKELVIDTSFAITMVDPVQDTVAGTVTPSTVVSVSWGGPGWYYSKDDTAAIDGTWMVDFTPEGDIVVGDMGNAAVYDNDGDATQLEWRAKAPYVQADLQPTRSGSTIGSHSRWCTRISTRMPIPPTAPCTWWGSRPTRTATATAVPERQVARRLRTACT